jgi:hypothetical protein
MRLDGFETRATVSRNLALKSWIRRGFVCRVCLGWAVVESSEAVQFSCALDISRAWE